MSYFEIAMLVCFGISWPISIAKSVRTKVVEGKSPLFMIIVAFGYGFGVLHKYHHSRDWVVFFYAFNMILVLTDLALYYYYSSRNGRGQLEYSN